MKPENKLKMNYFVLLVFNNIMIIVMIIGTIMIVKNRDSISLNNNEVFENVVFYVLIILISCCTLLFLKESIKYWKDIGAVMSNKFETIIGKVVKFAKNLNVDSGYQINSVPIIKQIDSDDLVKLRLDTFTKIGETYTFIFLKSTKLGTIKNKF
ncbi:MAG: hypothetical protein WCS56_03365 [Bacilli bacterium]